MRPYFALVIVLTAHWTCSAPSGRVNVSKTAGQKEAISESKNSQDVAITVGETGSATFTSPGYPAPYANNLAVSYHITGPPGRHLQLDVDFLQIESCCDLLQILHRDDQNGHYWIPLTAESAGDPVIVNDNRVLVYFRSDSSVTAGGFSLRATSISAGDRKANQLV